MIQLEYIEAKAENLGNVAETVELLKAAAKKQKELKIGNPTMALNLLLEKYSTPMLSEHFREVKKPSPLVFIAFASKYHYYSYANFVDGEGVPAPTTFPTLAQVELTENVTSIDLTVDGTHKSAAIPLMPRSCQEIAKRAQELIPSLKFHLLFHPVWGRSPNPDPVLLGEAAGRFFELCRWDGDAELLSSLLEDIVGTEV